MRSTISCPWIACVALLPLFGAGASADDKDAPTKAKHQVTGLFLPERVADLKETFAKIPQVKLVAVDYATAEATLEYVPTKAFPGAKSDQIAQRLDDLVRNASNHTFGIKPLRTIPLEKLQWVEIGVEGLDCKACCLAAYEAVYRLEGVEQATASFREERVRALIQPGKTDRSKLEAALKQRGVFVKMP